jgi:hypothetical protein
MWSREIIVTRMALYLDVTSTLSVLTIVRANTTAIDCIAKITHQSGGQVVLPRQIPTSESSEIYIWEVMSNSG